MWSDGESPCLDRGVRAVGLEVVVLRISACCVTAKESDRSQLLAGFEAADSAPHPGLRITTTSPSCTCNYHLYRKAACKHRGKTACNQTKAPTLKPPILCTEEQQDRVPQALPRAAPDVGPAPDDADIRVIGVDPGLTRWVQQVWGIVQGTVAHDRTELVWTRLALSDAVEDVACGHDIQVESRFLTSACILLAGNGLAVGRATHPRSSRSSTAAITVRCRPRRPHCWGPTPCGPQSPGVHLRQRVTNVQHVGLPAAICACTHGAFARFGLIAIIEIGTAVGGPPAHLFSRRR